MNRNFRIIVRLNRCFDRLTFKASDGVWRIGEIPEGQELVFAEGGPDGRNGLDGRCRELQHYA